MIVLEQTLFFSPTSPRVLEKAPIKDYRSRWPLEPSGSSVLLWLQLSSALFLMLQVLFIDPNHCDPNRMWNAA